jgi:TfoX/Sxy family transcriptional regulator of competence genes
MVKRPTMPKADPKAAEAFRKLLPTDSSITVRPMFGHAAAFVNGNMFAGTFGPHVFARLDETSRADVLALPGAAVFAPMKNRPMKEYVQLPADMVADPRAAKPWIARAFEWTSALPAKSKPGRTSKPAPGNPAPRRTPRRAKRT